MKMGDIFTDKVRNYILAVLIGLLAFFAGEGLFKVMEEPSLGSILRHNLGTLAVLALILAFCNKGFISELFSFKKFENLSAKQLLPMVFFGTLLGVIILNSSQLGIIYGGIALFVLACLGASVFYLFTQKKFYALCLFWCAYPFLYFVQTQIGQLGFERPEWIGMAVPFSAVYIVILFFFFATVGLNDRRFFTGKNLGFVYWIVLLSVPSLFFSDEPAKSSVYFLFDMIVPAMYFILVLGVIKNQKQLETTIHAIIISFAVLSMITFYFYFRGPVDEAAFDFYNVENSIIPLTALAGYGMMLAPFLLWLFKRTGKKLYLAAFSAMALFVMVCNKRSAMIALFVTLLAYFLLKKWPVIKKAVVLTLALICLGVFWISLVSFGDFSATENRLYASISKVLSSGSIAEMAPDRIEIWESAVRMIKDQPVMGIGAGMWPEYAFLYKSREYSDERDGYGVSTFYSIDAHNFFLQKYLDYGVFLFLFFLYFTYFVLRKCMVFFKKRTVDDSKTGLMIYATISFIIWVFFAMVGARFYSSGSIFEALLFWSFVAIILKSLEFQGTGSKT